MDASRDMRISIPPGTTLRGKKDTYKVKNIICLSERTVTVSCSDSNNREWRLKLYNGDSSINEEIQFFLMSHSMQGVILPSDIGEYSGIRFSVYEMIDATSADSFPIAIDILVSRIIPQMAYLIDQYHKMNVLLRDICPSHILYKPDEGKIAYCGFNNATLLRGKATITKEPGYGQEQSFIAPEVGNYGYSKCSDYFSLGTTILAMLKGYNPIEGVDRKVFIENLKNGKVPGVDVEHLRKTSPDLYSAEDRVMYLVLGLLIPDPRKRWEYGEIRCWLNDQMIPLAQKDERIRYQFNEPFVVGKTRCWNEKQLAMALASTKNAWTETTFTKLIEFARKQHFSCISELEECRNNKSFSGSGKIFRSIYAINPCIDGLWWEGVKYRDTHSLVQEVQNKRLSENAISNMLKDSIFSYFENIRSKLGMGNAISVSELQSIEKNESEEKGKGVRRFLMLFASATDDRYFEMEGYKYKNIYDFLLRYKNDGGKLRYISRDLLHNQSFQAWLWAKGLEPAGREAERIASQTPEQSMFFLLSLCENLETSEDAKKFARTMFLRWGDFSPIVWLCSNIKYYEVVSEADRSLYDVFKNMKFKLDNSLEELSRKGNDLVSDYQTFVGRTLDNPFILENERIEDSGYGYYPHYESGYFCCHWINGLEVCPAFVNSVGGGVDAGEINAWLKISSDDEIRKLNEKASLLPDFTNDNTDEARYMSVCNWNIACSIFMLVTAVILLVVTRYYSFGLGLLAFAASILFPCNSLLWYAKKKNRIDLWVRNKHDVRSGQSYIGGRVRNVQTRSKEICNGILSRSQNRTRKTDKGVNIVTLSLESPESLDLSSWQKVMAYLSSYGYVMLATICLGNIYSSFLSASIYAVIYGIGAPFLINRKRFVNSCFAWTVTTLILFGASIFGGMNFGNSFFVTMNWIPIVCLIVVAAICIFMMFM